MREEAQTDDGLTAIAAEANQMAMETAAPMSRQASSEARQAVN